MEYINHLHNRPVKTFAAKIALGESHNWLVSMFTRVMIACAALFMTTPAMSATSVYTDSSNFGAWPNAVNSGNAIGAPDGLSATIPNIGWIAFLETPSFTDAVFNINLTGVTGTGTALFYVGRSNGAGWFSTLNNRTVTLNAGYNRLSSVAQTNFCVSVGGCDVFIVQAFGGTTLNLDSALAVAANPEPSVWMLMILAFAGLALRMKMVRTRSAAIAPVWSANEAA